MCSVSNSYSDSLMCWRDTWVYSNYPWVGLLSIKIILLALLQYWFTELRQISQLHHSTPPSHWDWFRNNVRWSGQGHTWRCLQVFSGKEVSQMWPEEMLPLPPDQWYANGSLKLPQTFYHHRRSYPKDKAKPRETKLFIGSEPLDQSQPEASPNCGFPVH